MSARRRYRRLDERIVPHRLMRGFGECLRADTRGKPDAERTQQATHPRLREGKLWLPSERLILTSWSRAPSNVLMRWLSVLFTCTAVNQPVRSISARARHRPCQT